MDVIEMTRQLGVAIQQDSRFTEYVRAKEANDNDNELQTAIGDFNLNRQQLSIEMNKSRDEKDAKKIGELNKSMQELYGTIMGNKSMIEYNAAKQAFDMLIQQVNAIINASANGEDPLTCDTDAGCGGSCSSCAGCG